MNTIGSKVIAAVSLMVAASTSACAAAPVAVHDRHVVGYTYPYAPAYYDSNVHSALLYPYYNVHYGHYDGDHRTYYENHGGGHNGEHGGGHAAGHGGGHGRGH